MPRRLEARDLAQATAIQQLAFAGPAGVPLTTAFTLVQFEQELNRSSGCALAIDAPGGQLAGTLVAWFVADELHLHNIAVDPDQRRCGYGMRLLRALVEAAYAAAITVGYLEVEAHNHAAIALYRAWGAHTFNVRRGYYDDGSDALEMRILLDPVRRLVIPSADEVRI
jgi:[ribosomal protein S18]-alanine N-acetyltransferase